MLKTGIEKDMHELTVAFHPFSHQANSTQNVKHSLKTGRNHQLAPG
jgi:hypothetical protein